MNGLVLLGSVSGSKLNNVVNPVLDLINSIVPVALALVVAIGALYAIVLGVRYAKADDPQEHEKAKKGLINAIVGFVLIFVLIVMLRLLTPVLVDWMTTNSDEVTIEQIQGGGTTNNSGTTTQDNNSGDNATQDNTQDAAQ